MAHSIINFLEVLVSYDVHNWAISMVVVLWLHLLVFLLSSKTAITWQHHFYFYLFSQCNVVERERRVNWLEMWRFATWPWNGHPYATQFQKVVAQENEWMVGWLHNSRWGSAPACVGAVVCFVSMETILAWVWFHPRSSETGQWVLMIFIVTTVPL